MVVTEKCDIYSFDVLIIEVLTGKHPGELIIDLHSLVGTNVHLKDVLDDRLSPPIGQKIVYELALIVNLAVSCLHTNHNLAQQCKGCVISWRCRLLIIKVIFSRPICGHFVYVFLGM